MPETEATNAKPYPCVSADSELNKFAIKYLSDWRKEHPENKFNIQEMHEKSTLFREALKKGDYKTCAKIDEKELTEELKIEYIHLAARRGYIDV